MAYNKQFFKADDYLKAEQLNEMDNQIAANEAAISRKQDALVSGSNIKTINGQSILGEGNITISGNGTVEKTTEAEITAMGFTKNQGTITAVKINGTTKSPSNGVVDLGEIGSDGNSLPLSGGTLTGKLIAPSIDVSSINASYDINSNKITSNNIHFNDDDDDLNFSDTGSNYMYFWPAGSTINKGCKTFYRFLFGNGNITYTDVKAKMHGLTIGPAIKSNITDGTAVITLNEFDMHLDVSNTVGLSQLHIGNADRNNVVVYGRINHANKASQLYNKLAIAVDGVTTEFDGSSSKTININTKTAESATIAKKVENTLTLNVNGKTTEFDGSSSKTININTGTGSTELTNTTLFDVANTRITIATGSPTGTSYDNNAPAGDSINKDYVGEEKFIYKKLVTGNYFVNITVIPNNNVIKIVPTGSISNKSFTVAYNTSTAKIEYSLSFDLIKGAGTAIPGAPVNTYDPFLNSQLFEFKALVLDGETIKTVDASLPLYFNA